MVDGKWTYLNKYSEEVVITITVDETPTNVTAVQDGKNVVLTWEGTTNGFAVYETTTGTRKCKATTQEKTVTLTNVAEGEHKYSVRAANVVDGKWTYLNKYSEDVSF